MKIQVLMCVMLSACVNESVSEIRDEVVSPNVLSAANLMSSKTAASSIGGASLSSDSAAIQTLVSTAAGQATMFVIVACALASGSSVTATGPSGTLTFDGELGLATGWENSAPTAANRRWTTGCVLARTNLYGLSVSESLRHDTNPALAVGSGETSTYPTPQAAYYGDMFQAVPTMYACAAAIFTPTSNPALESVRACARSSNGVTTQCGFTYTWLCGSTLSGHAAACLDTTAPYGNCRGGGPTFAESVSLFL